MGEEVVTLRSQEDALVSLDIVIKGDVPCHVCEDDVTVDARRFSSPTRNMKGFKCEVKVGDIQYFLLILDGAPDIIHLGSIRSGNIIAIEGRIQYTGNSNWAVCMYYRGISGMTRQSFETICQHYLVAIPQLLAMAKIGLSVIPPQQIQD